MRTLSTLAILSGMTLMGLATPAFSQAIPDVSGLSPFTAETNFMSMVGFVRWQYFTENDVWISRAEAASLIESQSATTPTASAE